MPLKLILDHVSYVGETLDIYLAKKGLIARNCGMVRYVQE